MGGPGPARFLTAIFEFCSVLPREPQGTDRQGMVLSRGESLWIVHIISLGFEWITF